MRLFGITSYNGTNYSGWQKQNNKLTIQGKIEEIFSMYFNTPIHIFGSGRTDSGVHAYGQTFHFDVDKDYIDVDRLLYSVNSMLPLDIYILNIDIVDDNFHARYSLKKKEYLYMISLENKNPFLYQVLDIEKEPFDFHLFIEALNIFIGKHNFMNFTSKENDEENFVREIFSIKVVPQKDIISIYLEGDGFMRYMIRFIIGTSLAYARNKISKEILCSLLDPKDKKRHIVSFKAPASGLFLNKVYY